MARAGVTATVAEEHKNSIRNCDSSPVNNDDNLKWAVGREGQNNNSFADRPLSSYRRNDSRFKNRVASERVPTQLGGRLADKPVDRGEKRGDCRGGGRNII